MNTNMKQYKEIHGFIRAHETLRDISKHLNEWIKDYFDNPRKFHGEYGESMQVINNYLARALIACELEPEAAKNDETYTDNWRSLLLLYKRQMEIEDDEWLDFAEGKDYLHADG